MTITSYQDFQLDRFQQQAMEFIAAGRSVIVCAPTGVGKTLVADFLVEQSLRRGQKIVYTAPIKALSNQKYKEFKLRFGEDRVGIVTGDVSINPRGDCLVMTTEIFRNMVLAKEPFVDDISHVIFDEIHYIDSDRGVAWEESLIFAPPHIRVLGLSATIGNLSELVGWLSLVRGEEFAEVVEQKRVVPLIHYFYLLDASGKRVMRPMSNTEPPPFMADAKITHLDLIKAIKGSYLPALFFVFSRRQCAANARDTALALQLLTKQELAEVEAVLTRFGEVPGLAKSGDYRMLRSVLRRGIGYHHAGLLPVLKDMVEELFAQKLVKVLYCTETFSVGINYPVRAVCFDGQRKFDGKSVRPLKAQEYFQMAGRAGRRGMDEAGFVFTLVSDYRSRLENYPQLDVERLNSQFKLTFNSVLNLIKYVAPEHQEKVLTMSFASYLSGIDRREVMARYNLVEAEKKGFEQQICLAINDPSCPTNRRQLQNKLKSYEKLEARKHSEDPDLARRRDELRTLLERVPEKRCSPKKRGKCRPHKKQYNQILYRLHLVQAELDRLPATNTFVAEFARRRETLARLGYIEQDMLLPRGDMAAQIYIQELLITELIFAGMLEDLAEPEIVALLLGVDYPWRKFDTVLPCEDLKLHRWWSFINRFAGERTQAQEVVYTSYLAPIGYLWAKGEDLTTILDQCNLDEGDIVALLRREIDLLRQMRHALREVPHLAAKLTRCINLIDRDLVKVEL
ncbi:MAG: putative helicase HelY [Firmicutes bacterium]|nr:putative helicase HelY [candidate division NPL-UPA2 bacterium]